MRDLLDRGHAAVDGQHEPDALAGQPRQRLARDAVALVEAARQVVRDVGAELAQDEHGQRGRADPVGVVVAVDADPRPGRDRRPDRVAGLAHVAELERIVLGQLRVEERARLLQGRRSRAARARRRAPRSPRAPPRGPRPRSARTRFAAATTWAVHGTEAPGRSYSRGRFDAEQRERRDHGEGRDGDPRDEPRPAAAARATPSRPSPRARPRPRRRRRRPRSPARATPRARARSRRPRRPPARGPR